MFILFLLALVPTIVFACEVFEIHNDYTGVQDQDKPANDCNIEDYKFFDEYVNNNIRNN